MIWMERWLRRLLLVAVLLAGATGWIAYIHYTDPPTVRRLVLESATKQLPRAVVQLDSATASLLGGLRVSGLRVHGPDSGGNHPLIAEIERAVLWPDRARLLEQGLCVRRALLYRPRLHLHRRSDGTWNVEDISTAQKITFATATDIEIQEANLRITLEQPDLQIELSEVNATIRLQPPTGALFILEGTSNWIGGIRLTGELDLSGPSAKLEIESKEPIAIGRLLDVARRMGHDPTADFGSIDGKITVKGAVTVAHTGGQLDWDVALDGGITRGRLVHPKLPHPVTAAEGKLSLTRRGLSKAALVFEFGGAAGEVHASAINDSNESLTVQGTLTGLPLSEAIYNALPTSGKQTWEKLDPKGAIDVDIQLVKSGGDWKPTARITLRDDSIRFYRFPYPVGNINGAVELHADRRITIDADGWASNRPVSIHGVIAPGGPTSAMDLVIEGKGVPFDELLLKVLDDTSETAGATARRFSGTGRGDFVARAVRIAGSSQCVVTVEVDCQFDKAQTEYFHYPLENVSGHLSIEPARTVFRDFTGTAGGAIVKVQGQFVKTTQGTHIETFVKTQNVPLDEKLRTALAPSWRNTWDRLKPVGTADIECTVIQPPGQPRDVRLVINPVGASITPNCFPYQLDGHNGQIEFANNLTYWNNLTVRHGQSTLITSTGQIWPTDDGGQIEFQHLVCSSLAFDDDLRQALLPSLQKVFDYFQPDRPVDIELAQLDPEPAPERPAPPTIPALVVRWFQDPTQSLQSEFHGRVHLRDTRLLPAIGVTGTTGVINLVGACNGTRHRIEGQVQLAQATVKGFTISNVASEFSAIGGVVKFPAIQGGFYGGTMAGSIDVDCNSGPKYECDFRATQASLGRYMRQRQGDSTTVDGLVDARVRLYGSGGASKWPAGKGSIKITKADIYRASVVQEIFRLLRFQEPNGRAFDEVECYFHLADGSVIVERLDLLGPAISLVTIERGSLDLETQQLDVRLYPRWGKGRLHIPFLTDVINLASDELISVEVGGTLSDPKPRPASMTGVRRLFEPKAGGR